ncbi:nucleoside-diphosphate kinase [Streptomyces murinus]|uniref:nucleoside-diphosphate kinase n=1 Tax=Streptomyces murinus TaxID=33900 RepID=UPI003F488CFD
MTIEDERAGQEGQSFDESVWQTHAFCLISPDSLREQRVGAILDHLAVAGFKPVGWREVRVTAQQIDAIAEIQNVGAGSTFRYRALDALFSLGPSVALRLRDEVSRSAAERYAVLHEIKGGTPPRTRPGSIRHEVGSVNAILSLLHLSDSPANAARESAAILGPEPLAAFHDGGTLDGYLSVLARTQPKESRDHVAVLGALRGRIVSALWTELGDEGRALAERLTARGELARPDAGRRLADLVRPEAAGHPLLAVLAHPFDPSAAPWDLSEVDLVLRRYGCACDSWETAVLTTSQYFEPVLTTKGAHGHADRDHDLGTD